MARDPVIPPMDLASGELAKRLMQPSKDAKREDAPKPALQDGAPENRPRTPRSRRSVVVQDSARLSAPRLSTAQKDSMP